MDLTHGYLYYFEVPMPLPGTPPGGGASNNYSTPPADYGTPPADLSHKYEIYGLQPGPWILPPPVQSSTKNSSSKNSDGTTTTTTTTFYAAESPLPTPSAGNLQYPTGPDGTATTPIFHWPTILLMADDHSSDATDAPNGSLDLIATLSCSMSNGTPSLKYVMLSLVNCTTSPPSITQFNPSGGLPILWGNKTTNSDMCSHPANDKHGYYTQQVIVEMSPDPTQVTSADGWNLSAWSPPTTTGDVTSSTSSSISVNLLGGTPGAAASAQKGTSVTVPDFSVADESGGGSNPLLVKSIYSLTAYPQPNDLLGSWPKYDLADLPATAMSNLPLPTQGQWSVPASFMGTVNLLITITATVAFEEKSSDGVPSTHSIFATAQRKFIVPVDFSLIQ